MDIGLFFAGVCLTVVVTLLWLWHEGRRFARRQERERQRERQRRLECGLPERAKDR